jgi:signal transduction histidine kinase
MSRGASLRRAIRWLAGLLLSAAGIGVTCADQPPALQPVSACVQLQGDSACRPMATDLPFHWDLHHAAAAGSARFTFRFDSGGDAAQALLLPRLGNGFSVRLNGRLLQAVGADERQRHDTVKRPWLLPLPDLLLLPRGNVLEITLHAADGRGAQLHPPTVAAHAALLPAYDRIYLWRVEVTRALMWMSVMLGLMSLLVWVVQREAIFIACGVAELSWAARLAEMFWIDMPLPWQWWGAAVAANFALMQLALLWVFLNAVDQWTVLTRRAWWLYAALWAVVVPLIVLLRWRDGWVGWIVGITVMHLALAGCIGVLSWRQRQHWRWLFIAWVLCSIGAGLADVAESPGSMYMHPTWSRLVMAAFSLAMVGLVARRLQQARAAERAQAGRLANALQQQAQQLRAAHAAAAQADLQRAMLAERSRVMRDMHDGLGSQLSGLLTLTGRDPVPRDALQSQVRDAIDELRSVVDAMHTLDGDIASLLASLRPQFERRLAAANITLRWAVDELPETPQVTPAMLQQLRRLLLEAITNVARHSGAAGATLSAHADGDGIEIQVTDDGHGFTDDGQPSGNGLRNMHWRARELGATLQVDSGRTGTRLRLRMPTTPRPRPAGGFAAVQAPPAPG